MFQPLYSRQRATIPTVREAGWALGLVWKGAENIAVTEVQTLDCPAHSELLHQLHYPGRQTTHVPEENIFSPTFLTEKW